MEHADLALRRRVDKGWVWVWACMGGGGRGGEGARVVWVGMGIFGSSIILAVSLGSVVSERVGYGYRCG